MDAKLIIKRVIFYSLVVFFSTITALKLLFSWFQKRGNYFYTLEHKKPKALEEWSEGFVQLSVNLLIKLNKNYDILGYQTSLCRSWRQE